MLLRLDIKALFVTLVMQMSKMSQFLHGIFTLVTDDTSIPEGPLLKQTRTHTSLLIPWPRKSWS